MQNRLIEGQIDTPAKPLPLPRFDKKSRTIFCSVGCCKLPQRAPLHLKLPVLHAREAVFTSFFGIGKRGHYERGFSQEESLEPLKSLNSLDSPENDWFSTFTRISRMSKFFRISRKWTFWKEPLSKRPLFRTRFCGAALGVFWRCVGASHEVALPVLQ